MKKIMISIGTRPEAIKLLPLVSCLRGSAELFLLFTGQHGELAKEVFSLFGERYDKNLAVMERCSDLSALSSEILSGAAECIRGFSPDVCVVQGDTVSAYSVALAAFLAKIPIAHVEAGLRTWDSRSPYPEECFRRFISIMASLHFAPDGYARKNLLCDSVRDECIFVTGNTVIDAVRRFAPLNNTVEKKIIFTMHRRETRGEYPEILSAVARLAREREDIRFIALMHPSKSVSEPMKRYLSGIDNLELNPPMPLSDFYSELSSALLVLTDSGGVSEEAALLGVPTVVLREKTERTRELSEGKIILAGTSGVGLCELVANAEKVKRKRPKISLRPSESIKDILLSFI